MYLHKIPGIIHRLYPDYLWRCAVQRRVLYLTFDDGPSPGITDWVLDQLASYRARATFFMIGDKVQRYPEIAHRIIDSHHHIGNHTQHHLNGKKTSGRRYIKDFLQGKQSILEYTGIRTRLFRPPYGRITSSQAKLIMRSHQIVMMDVISGDFDQKLHGDTCYEKVVRYARPGSIIVMHDSKKAWDRLSVALPQLLAHFSDQGYRFEALPIPESPGAIP